MLYDCTALLSMKVSDSIEAESKKEAERKIRDMLAKEIADTNLYLSIKTKVEESETENYEE